MSLVRLWQSYLAEALNQDNNVQLEYTVPEVLGAANISLAALKLACGIATTRYVASHARRRLMLLPVFDMVRYYWHCRPQRAQATTGAQPPSLHSLSVRNVRVPRLAAACCAAGQPPARLPDDAERV